MGAIAIVGANWGDEGKGKMTDLIAVEADYVVRFQGGSNAGHTVINDFGKFALHLLPSGVFYPHVMNVLGPGVALDLAALVKEIDSLVSRGVPAPNVCVSERAQVVMPYHALLDRLEEGRLGDRKFGSTRSGIAPFYSDKYLKIGVQVADLYDEARLVDRLEAALTPKNVLFRALYDHDPIDAKVLAAELRPLADQVRPYVCDTTRVLHEGLKAGKRVLLEGQLGALRDPDHGIYPFSTSSSTLAGFATVGGGVPPSSIERVIAVAKAYSSCVGAGPFVTELLGADGDELRERGGDAGEYGATTGRPRRMGWFDAVATRYGCRVQGATEVALTLLDVLGFRDEIPLCNAYEIDGEKVIDFPTNARLERAKPVYETLPGWKCDISGIREYSALPKEAQAYVERVEELIEVPIRSISVGPRRDAIIWRNGG